MLRTWETKWALRCAISDRGARIYSYPSRARIKDDALRELRKIQNTCGLDLREGKGKGVKQELDMR